MGTQERYRGYWIGKNPFIEHTYFVVFVQTVVATCSTIEDARKAVDSILAEAEMLIQHPDGKVI